MKSNITIITILILAVSSVSACSFRVGNAASQSDSPPATNEKEDNQSGNSSPLAKKNISSAELTKAGFYYFEQGGHSGNLMVTELGENRLQVNLTAKYQYRTDGETEANSGSAEGVGKLNGDTAILVPEGFNACEIKLTFVDYDTVIVAQKGAETDCGFGASVAASGIYKRIITDSEPSSKFKSNAESDLQTENRIRFKRGASSATVSGTIKNGQEKTHIIGARVGQTMDIKITDGGANNDVVFHVVAPDGSLPMGGGESPEYDSAWNGKLRKTGDYKIVVGVIESEKVNFKMSVAIRYENSSKSVAPKKLAEFTYRKMKHAVYLITNFGEDAENVEFVKIAQKLHDAEPDTALILIDDDSGLKRYLAFMKEVERIGGGAPDNIEFPKDWAEEHILGNVGAEDENRLRRWYLMLGYAHEKIAELK